jgi:hypothetical protein
MKKSGTFRFLILGFGVLLISGSVFGQQPLVMPSLPDTSQMVFNQISRNLGLFVFPSQGQSEQYQKEDEFDCYRWAISNSGIDPTNPPKVDMPPPPSGPTGAAVGGAARGAAAGAAIGLVAGNAGRGAAIGATAGAIGGRSAGRQAQQQAGQQQQNQARAKEQEQMNSFVRAFSACMQGKGYTIQ